ncbi:UDP-glucuronosyl/UDP-glucosyltransferase [Dillenia turbinata]|uniref:UDP-glucuronosyl/UDP-glucosyltransferase n=1 Tax=Dillenia turbinata TaxID=194707 RepID=A0AAN8ZC37_9MAGN
MSEFTELNSAPHVALLPGSGMGHLNPFLRLAVSLTNQRVQVSFITTHPIVSKAESKALACLFSANPKITCKEFHLVPFDKSSADSEDPFYLQCAVIRRSSHLLSPLLSSFSPPLSALITDMNLASTVIPVTEALHLPNYILFTSSAQMLSLFVSFPVMVSSKVGGDSDIEGDILTIPGLQEIPKTWIPPFLLNMNKFFRNYFIENGKKTLQSKGILVNTFESLELQTLKALNDGKVVWNLPPVFAIGPFMPYQSSPTLTWLDDQPSKSVVYVCFGSRSALSREQIKELAVGLTRCQCRFLWVVDDNTVNQESSVELDEVLGHEFQEKVKDKGLVVRDWISQEEILGHPAIGWFLSHCGWNSILEAVWHGVPILAWPQMSDQKMNADVVERSGIGMWEKSWGWGDEKTLVNSQEIGEELEKIMRNELIREQAKQMREEARRAVAGGGSSKNAILDLVEIWNSL